MVQKKHDIPAEPDACVPDGPALTTLLPPTERLPLAPGAPRVEADGLLPRTRAIISCEPCS